MNQPGREYITAELQKAIPWGTACGECPCGSGDLDSLYCELMEQEITDGLKVCTINDPRWKPGRA
jgi:bacterioferritin-associated ferredoxin